MFASILIFIVVLSVLIMIHELGHFLVARYFGVKVEEFGFGLPPRIIGKQFGETLYSLNAIPFGGFVKLYGEQTDDGVTDMNRAFLNKSKKIRVLVIIAGVVMNFLLGVVAFAIVYSFSGIPRDMGKLKVIDVSSGSPAQTAGIVVGDIVTKVGQTPVSTSNEFIDIVANHKGARTKFEIERSGATVTYTITPRESPPEGEGPLGVTITNMELYFPPVWLRPFYGIYYGTKEAIFWGQTIFLGLIGLIVGVFKGAATQGVSGPIGIFAVTTEAARTGILTLVNFVGILSINLAIFNIIPFPALDGGRLLFIGIEKLLGRKILPKIELILNNIGFFSLILFLILITIGDIRKLITFGGIEGFINSMVK